MSNGDDWQSRPFQPDWVSPPGDTILDVMQARGITADAFAARMDMTLEEVGQLVAGYAVIDQSIADRLEQVIGASATFWLRRDEQYRQDCRRLGKTPGEG